MHIENEKQITSFMNCTMQVRGSNAFTLMERFFAKKRPRSSLPTLNWTTVFVRMLKISLLGIPDNNSLKNNRFRVNGTDINPRTDL